MSATPCPCAFHARERELLDRIRELADRNDALRAFVDCFDAPSVDLSCMEVPPGRPGCVEAKREPCWNCRLSAALDLIERSEA